MPLITFSPQGLYCPQGDFFIDPWKPVDRAIISHGHSDHARWGSKSYLCHTDSLPILKARLGTDNAFQTLAWNQPLYINGVEVTLFPAGHVIGSSQVRVSYKGETWVFTGDFKPEDDGISGAFEPVSCQHFITECTFGLPIYKWQPQEQLFSSMRQWAMTNEAMGRSSVFIAYSLGKAQRVLKAIAPLGRPILMHGAIWNMHQALCEGLPGYFGKDIPCQRITKETPKEVLKNALVMAPPSADGTPWMKRFSPAATGVCSGWMQVRGHVRRRNADAGFVMSDHSDWPGLLQTVADTGAEKVYATHGFTAAFSRYLNDQGIWSAEVKTQYGAEEETTEATEEAETEPSPENGNP